MVLAMVVVVVVVVMVVVVVVVVVKYLYQFKSGLRVDPVGVHSVKVGHSCQKYDNDHENSTIDPCPFPPTDPPSPPPPPHTHTHP